MTDTWGMSGAASFMAKPTTAQQAAEAHQAWRRSLTGSPEDIHAERDRQRKVLTDRHATLLATVDHAVLKALIEAHGPSGEVEFPTCSTCPEIHDDYGDSDPRDWPCDVWTFISDRMETP